MKIYRVGIIGCRGRGTAAARAYHDHPRTELVGLCDLVEERLTTLGDEVGVSARFNDLDEMIRQTAPDIVAIPTGTEFHYDLCMRVLEHGVHIEVEKPMCIDLTQADAICALANEKGVRVAVHHQGRVGAAMRAVEEALKAGKIGELRYIVSTNKGYYGGYGLMNIGTHKINDMLKFAGHCRNVMGHATTNGFHISPDDVRCAPGGMGTIAGQHITAVLQFDNNVTATLLHDQFEPINVAGSVMEFYGSEGRLFRHTDRVWWLPHAHFVPNREDNRWEALAAIYPPNKRAAADDYWFVDEYVHALDEGQDHECSGIEARHVIEVMMGIFESAAYGTRVDLPQENRAHPLLRWRKEAGLSTPQSVPRSYRDWLTAELQRLDR